MGGLLSLITIIDFPILVALSLVFVVVHLVDLSVASRAMPPKDKGKDDARQRKIGALFSSVGSKRSENTGIDVESRGRETSAGAGCSSRTGFCMLLKTRKIENLTNC